MDNPSNLFLTKQRTARNSQDLIEAGLISSVEAGSIDEVSKSFSIAVTSEMISLIDLDNPDDAISRQFIPDVKELQIQAEELADPIGDIPHTPIKGISHRYPDRVLLKPTHVCPVYCRFCFRREFVGDTGEGLSPAELDAALNYIQDHSEIWEVILTGGDPLILPKSKLSQIIAALEQIEHVDVIRIHTRIPAVDPSRIDTELVKILKVSKPVYVVLHTNHPNEFSHACRTACAMLTDAGIPMLGQTVLLKGVNDSPETLTQLLRMMVKNRIKPYYLHHADMAKGTSHFRTTIDEGQSLMRAIRGRVSGICQPTYVLDIPGGYGKIPIGPQYLQPSETSYFVEDPWSKVHVYPPQS